MTTRSPSPPAAVRWIARTLEEAGHATWAVGGAVRDVLAGLPAGDWDLTTHATPKQMRLLFKRTVPLGVEHGTVGILDRQGVMYEVTTFRRDVHTDGRHAVVAFAETIDEDLARRDFTINAIAWHPLREELLDPFGGAADLDAGRLRTVGVPEERFREDWLRVLRAIRFASRFGLEVEAKTWHALCAATSHLTSLSAERIRDEILKILDADRRPSRALGLLRESGALEVIFPELNARASGPAWIATLEALDRLPAGNPLQRLAALLVGTPAHDAAQLLMRLRLSNAHTDRVARRAAAPPLPGAEATDGDARRWLARVGREHLSGVARIQLAHAPGPEEARAVVEAWRRCRVERGSGVPLTLAELALDGRDLIRMGLKPGPDFSRILEMLLERVIEDPDRNDAEALRREVRRIADELEGGAGG